MTLEATGAGSSPVWPPRDNVTFWQLPKAQDQEGPWLEILNSFSPGSLCLYFMPGSDKITQRMHKGAHVTSQECPTLKAWRLKQLPNTLPGGGGQVGRVDVSGTRHRRAGRGTIGRVHWGSSAWQPATLWLFLLPPRVALPVACDRWTLVPSSPGSCQPALCSSNYMVLGCPWVPGTP